MKWHPFAEKFPLLEGEEWEAFKASIRETNGPETRVTYRMVKGEKQGLDGRNRHRACEELGIECPMEKVFLSDDEVKPFIIRRNVRRRHLLSELRLQLVLEMRSEGMSTRRIADAIGVSPSTIRRDLEEPSGAPIGAPEMSEKAEKDENQVTAPNGKVTGSDGKTYQATKPKPTPRAKVNAESNGHTNGHHEASGKGKPARATKPADAGGDVGKPGEPTDAVGHLVPAASRDAFANLERFRALDSLARQLQAGIDELSTLPGGEQLRRHLKATGSEDRSINRSEHLDALKRDLKFTRPHAVCPWCAGKAAKSCKGCSGTGWVSKITWDNADESTKAKLPCSV